MTRNLTSLWRPSVELMAKFKFRDFFPQSENYLNNNSKVSNETKKLANTLTIFKNTVEFRKLATRLIFFTDPFWGAYFWRGLSTEENLRFKIDWASLIVGSEFTVFALFYFVFEGNFPSTSPRGAYIWTGLGGLYLEGFVHGGAYFRNFTVTVMLWWWHSYLKKGLEPFAILDPPFWIDELYSILLKTRGNR